VNRGPKIVLLILLFLAGWVVYQYVETGKWGVLPIALTENEKRVRTLEKRLEDLNGRIAAQERTTGMAGAAPPVGLEQLYAEREQVTADLDAARAEVRAGR